VNKRAEHLFATRTCWRKVLQFLLTKDCFFFFFLLHKRNDQVWSLFQVHKFLSKLSDFCRWSGYQIIILLTKFPSEWLWFWTNSVTMQPESSPSSSVALLCVQDKIMGQLQCYKYTSWIVQVENHGCTMQFLSANTRSHER
jgi:hypothetical protein